MEVVSDDAPFADQGCMIAVVTSVGGGLVRYMLVVRRGALNRTNRPGLAIEERLLGVGSPL